MIDLWLITVLNILFPWKFDYHDTQSFISSAEMFWLVQAKAFEGIEGLGYFFNKGKGRNTKNTETEGQTRQKNE